MPERVLGPVLAAVIIAAALVFTFRYSVSSVPPRPAAIRLDRWTGDMRFCVIQDDDRAMSLKCDEK